MAGMANAPGTNIDPFGTTVHTDESVIDNLKKFLDNWLGHGNYIINSDGTVTLIAGKEDDAFQSLLNFYLNEANTGIDGGGATGDIGSYVGASGAAFRAAYAAASTAFAAITGTMINENISVDGNDNVSTTIFPTELTDVNVTATEAKGGNFFLENLGNIGLVASAGGQAMDRPNVSGLIRKIGRGFDLGGETLGLAGAAYDTYRYRQGKLSAARFAYHAVGFGASEGMAHAVSGAAGLETGGAFLYLELTYDMGDYLWQSFKTSFTNWSNSYINYRVWGQ